jgi:hypothetical protein
MFRRPVLVVRSDKAACKADYARWLGLPTHGLRAPIANHHKRNGRLNAFTKRAPAHQVPAIYGATMDKQSIGNTPMTNAPVSDL